jgi:hypothetical protein
MINPHTVAMDLEALGFATHQGDSPRCRGKHWGTIAPAIIDPPMVIVFGKYAIIVATNSID